MKTIYQLPTREPPRQPPPWPPGRASQSNQQFAKNKTIKETIAMKKDRKKQDDRLLKRLPLQERRVQERLRHQILAEKLFLAV